MTKVIRRTLVSGCLAQQYSDTMVCVLCSLTWDVNDPTPPQCQAKPKNLAIIRLLERVQGDATMQGYRVRGFNPGTLGGRTLQDDFDFAVQALRSDET